MTTYGEAPMIECPACGAEVQLDDYYDTEEGHERECPKCCAELVCTGVETVIRWSWNLKGGGT